MARRSFDQEWREKLQRVRASDFWQQVSSPPRARIQRDARRPRRDETELTPEWVLCTEGGVAPSGPANTALEDLHAGLHQRLGVKLKRRGTGPRLTFRLAPSGARSVSRTRWERDFQLLCGPDGIRVSAPDEPTLLRAALFLGNYWCLRRNPYLRHGQRRVRPAAGLHLGADLWGGFCTTQAWIHGRESDTNFLELARVGINAVPVLRRSLVGRPGPGRAHRPAGSGARHLPDGDRQGFGGLARRRLCQEHLGLLHEPGHAQPPVPAAAPPLPRARPAVFGEDRVQQLDRVSECALPAGAREPEGDLGNARQLRPQAIHSRWLFDGACKSPSEELGYWALWGARTEFADLDAELPVWRHALQQW